MYFSSEEKYSIHIRAPSFFDQKTKIRKTITSPPAKRASLALSIEQLIYKTLDEILFRKLE